MVNMNPVPRVPHNEQSCAAAASCTALCQVEERLIQVLTGKLEIEVPEKGFKRI